MTARPDTASIGQRANALGATYVRGRVEGGLRFSSGVSQKRWAALGLRLGCWAKTFPGLTPIERVLHQTPLGAWSEQQVADAEWSLEALGMLLWSLRLRPLSAWDRPFVAALLPWVDTPSWYNESGPATVGRPLPRPRPSEAVDEMCDRAEAWHWRAVTAQRTPTASLRAIIRDAAREGAKRGWFRVREGDFPYRGKAYATLSAESRQAAWSIALERHRALVWLTSEGERWDRVEVET